MNKEKYVIEILDGGELKYSVVAKRKNSEITNSFYNFQAEKIDKRFLLRRDTSGEADQIFGIADTPEEADKRIYDEALKISKHFESVYGEVGTIESIINSTKKGKL